MLGFIKNLKAKNGNQVWYTCSNNAGENMDFEKAHKLEGMGIEFEYSAPGTL